MVSHLPILIIPGYPKACLRDRTHFLPLDGRCDKECLGVFYPSTEHLPCSVATSNPVMIFFNPPAVSLQRLVTHFVEEN